MLPWFGFNRSTMMACTRKSILILAGIVCLGLRALVPAGYMPGNLLAGEFMVLCPSGMQADFVQQLHPDQGVHDTHSAHDQGVVDADTSCPIGSALQLAVLPIDEVRRAVSIDLPRHAADIAQREIAATHRYRYQSRAPPPA